ncbi:HAD-IIIA family hydrolase [Halioxenophilus sp. WMMB6]|uniref:HAD-IIIA family hydrolase n=1 Tax=Halioxenophilus sp. WMMB6 TaxID=3073815 RepID=UPI00295F387E|nr:HAD-IIIA family hydrolase [Halioxenophilus sp. WMMB6]
MLFVFDWDGTLCNSLDKIVRCLQEAANLANLEDLSAAEAKSVIGLALPEAIQQLLPDEDISTRAQVADFYRDAFNRDTSQPQLFDGAKETLLELKERGYRLAVATGKSRAGLDRGLYETGLQNFFCATRCADETASKPNPKMLLELLAELNMCHTRAVMVGDTTFDLAMANAAGMRGIGVSFGSHSVAELNQHRPAVIIDHIKELLGWQIEPAAANKTQ